MSTKEQKDDFAFSCGNMYLYGKGVDVYRVKNDDKKWLLSAVMSSGRKLRKSNDVIITKKFFDKIIREDDPTNQSAECLRALKFMGIETYGNEE